MRSATRAKRLCELREDVVPPVAVGDVAVEVQCDPDAPVRVGVRPARSSMTIGQELVGAVDEGRIRNLHDPVGSGADRAARLVRGRVTDRHEAGGPYDDRGQQRPSGVSIGPTPMPQSSTGRRATRATTTRCEDHDERRVAPASDRPVELLDDRAATEHDGVAADQVAQQRPPITGGVDHLDVDVGLELGPCALGVVGVDDVAVFVAELVRGTS